MALAIFILLTHTVFYQQLQPSSLVPQLIFSLSEAGRIQTENYLEIEN